MPNAMDSGEPEETPGGPPAGAGRRRQEPYGPDTLTPEELTEYLPVERVAAILHSTVAAVNMLANDRRASLLLKPVRMAGRWYFLAENVRVYQLWAQRENEKRGRGRPRRVGRIIPSQTEPPDED